MKKLYGSNKRIKVDLIKKALLNAKREGDLPNVSREDVGRFVDGFEEKMIEFRNKVGTQITQREVEFLLKSMRLNREDKISNSELDTIAKIILDLDFDID